MRAKSRAARWLVLSGALLGGHTAMAGDEIEHAAGAAAGVFAGIYVHEAGHALVYGATGADHVRIRVPGSQCHMLCGETSATWPAEPGRQVRRTNSLAGFVTSNLGAELMLQHDGAARSGFGQGFLATNLYSNVAHVFTYYTKVRGRNGYRGNDIDDYEVAGGNPHLLAAGLIAYSVFAVHRMHRKEIPVLFMKLRF